MDFTLRKYEQLLKVLMSANYSFQTLKSFITNPEERAVILRHDVDARKKNALHFAKLQAEKGIKATYYFRVVPQSYDVDIMREINSLGHEIGYHYETMDSCNGDIELAYEEFRNNLGKFRKHADIKTICMHGSPMSKYDNRDLWKKYDYKSLGLIAEPYFDIDFNLVMYLTDTGRRWDGDKIAVRDKIMINEARSVKVSIHSTDDIIQAVESNHLPDKVLLTFHPQRWNNKPMPWLRELVFQNIKNQVKRYLINR